ncbi:MAG: hypothetical protein NDJ24_04345 [Alphaproteobacteria bacterium]|nr:hypothetical protein [Alphaproteobacteria bacterium]
MAVGSVTSGAGATPTNTASLSPVQRLIKQQEDEAARYKVGTDDEPYTEQDWYINAKVAQLKGQIYTYSNFPGLDPSGAMMDSLTAEVNELVGKQQAKLKKANDEAAAKQAELDRLEEEKRNAPISVEDLLARAKLRAEGKEPEAELSDAVKKLLDKSKGALVDKEV